MQTKQGDLAGALKSYRDSLAVVDRLTKVDLAMPAGSMIWPHHMNVSGMSNWLA